MINQVDFGGYLTRSCECQGQCIKGLANHQGEQEQRTTFDYIIVCEIESKSDNRLLSPFVLAGLLLLMAAGTEIWRIVYARWEVGKAVDAAVLAAASQINIATYG